MAWQPLALHSSPPAIAWLVAQPQAERWRQVSPALRQPRHRMPAPPALRQVSM